jgi:hypothetical protein
LRPGTDPPHPPPPGLAALSFLDFRRIIAQADGRIVVTERDFASIEIVILCKAQGGRNASR